ncbi:serine/arginine repetitive matrix protein 1-like [Rhinatrema bivittatum]|uniref:serine/arginine repetitive matrix protein 1-like n=1 Tax=Rhinatrema bivittatum TaxID=194408 RepID=UPI0011268D02|nr:serine/arginine repetitive matrix protein 1-like [Rhinatrema bivittatum]
MSKSGFKRCRCGRVMSRTDGHDRCYCCLGVQHKVKECEFCAKMSPRAQRQRAYRLQELLTTSDPSEVQSSPGPAKTGPHQKKRPTSCGDVSSKSQGSDFQRGRSPLRAPKPPSSKRLRAASKHGAERSSRPTSKSAHGHARRPTAHDRTAPSSTARDAQKPQKAPGHSSARSASQTSATHTAPLVDLTLTAPHTVSARSTAHPLAQSAPQPSAQLAPQSSAQSVPRPSAQRQSPPHSTAQSAPRPLRKSAPQQSASAQESTLTPEDRDLQHTPPTESTSITYEKDFSTKDIPRKIKVTEHSHRRREWYSLSGKSTRDDAAQGVQSLLVHRKRKRHSSQSATSSSSHPTSKSSSKKRKRHHSRDSRSRRPHERSHHYHSPTTSQRSETFSRTHSSPPSSSQSKCVTKSPNSLSASPHSPSPSRSLTPAPRSPRPQPRPPPGQKPKMPAHAKEAFLQLSQSLTGFYETLESAFTMTVPDDLESSKPKSPPLVTKPRDQPLSPSSVHQLSPAASPHTFRDSRSPSPSLSRSSSTGFPSDPLEQPQEPYSPPEDLTYPRFLEKIGKILHLSLQKEADPRAETLGLLKIFDTRENLLLYHLMTYYIKCY